MHKYSYSIRNCIIEFSLLFYITSLLIPMYYISPAPLDVNPGGLDTLQAVPSLWVFITGLLSTPNDLWRLLCHGDISAAYSFIWLPNIAYFYILLLLRNRKSTIISYALTIPSILFILLFYGCHEHVTVCNEQEVFFIGYKGIGYYTWLLSFITLLCAIVYDSIYRRNRTPDIANKSN